MPLKTKNTYQILDTYCLRTPLFPFSFYKNLCTSSVISHKEFTILVQNTVFKEALFLASPSLYSQIIKWGKGEITDIQKIERLQFSILKYATRIATRCTPFGLFASCAAGTFDINTNIQLTETNNYYRFTRFDTTFLTQLFQELLQDAACKKQLLFYPNTSLYKMDTHYRYVEYLLEKNRRTYSLEGIQNSDYIDLIFETSINGKTISELALLLTDDDTTQKEAEDFIELLIKNQLLVSELEITVTGNDYFESLLNSIQQIPNTSKIHHTLEKLQTYLTRLDTTFGNTNELYQKISKTAKEFVPTLDEKYLLQTDCFTNTINNTLNSKHKQQLKKAFLAFNRITLPTANRSIEDFKSAFLKRYEQATVPLTLALDTETGIGFGTKKEDSNILIDDLSLVPTKKRYQRIVWTDVDTLLQKKLEYATRNNQYTINLSEKDLTKLPVNWNDLPDTLSSIIEIYTINEEEKIFIKNSGGSSAVNLLGRFCYGDEKLYTHAKQITDIEENIHKTKIIAEIVHLPEARTGNILQRPILRAYEIPYVGKSNVALQYQISIEDILVSIKNDTIVLWSKKLNKEILPRLGNAHNYSANPLPIYQFLCELQTQNKRTGIGFSWNKIHKQQSFLPRVEFENIIFSKARWLINVESFKKLGQEKELLLEIEKWRKELQMPPYVNLVEGDNTLVVHLKNKTAIYMLLHTVKNKEQFILEEFLFEENGIVTGKTDAFCNQFVVSFYNESKLNAANNAE